MSLSSEQNDRLTEILQVLGAEIESITGNSRSFVEDQIKRHAQYGEETRMSPKQWSWLESLYERHAKLPEPKPAPDIDDDIPF